MDLETLVHAIVSGDLIAAREWVADAKRSAVRWESIPRPNTRDARDLAIAAGLAELLAQRDGVRPPTWTIEVSGVDVPFLLDPGLGTMPRSFAFARKSAPEPLRKRNLIALPDFLKIA